MNLLILEESEKISKNQFKIQNRKLEHFTKILKVKIGDTLKAGILNESIGNFKITKIEKNEILGEYVFQSNEEYSIFSNIRFYIAYQRPQTTKKIIQLASNLSVKEIYFFPCEKSEKSYQDSKIWEEQNLKNEIILGLEQGKKIYSPKIYHILKFHELKNYFQTKNPFILHPNTNEVDLVSLNLNLSFYEFILGSESGFTEKEIIYFEKNNCKSISISDSILRTESAFLYLLSQIEFKKKSHQ